MKDIPRPPQASLLLRVLGGGYLIYLAWELRGTTGESKLFLAAVIAFGLAGALLVFFSIRELVISGYFRNDPETLPSDESEEDTHEEY